MSYQILGVCHVLLHTLKVWYDMSVWRNAMTASPDRRRNSCRRKHNTCMGFETEVACTQLASPKGEEALLHPQHQKQTL